MKHVWLGFALSWALIMGSSGCASTESSEVAGTRASLGCEDGVLDSSVTHVDLQHDGNARSYELYVPSTYDGNAPLPLVLNFHGFTSSGPVSFSGSCDSSCPLWGGRAVWAVCLDSGDGQGRSVSTAESPCW